MPIGQKDIVKTLSVLQEMIIIDLEPYRTMWSPLGHQCDQFTLTFRSNG